MTGSTLKVVHPSTEEIKQWDSPADTRVTPLIVRISNSRLCPVIFNFFDKASDMTDTSAPLSNRANVRQSMSIVHVVFIHLMEQHLERMIMCDHKSLMSAP
ncbi:hypothetical protein M513_11440 [Trichuris suis]|uniref:Uncharacterized protein n=1 Tax=Trichuris suis TaxID=68888 RepID=A0A085LRQ3_9BILA|nr:hypothetical protein M513_11440 [Trichuris suis]